MIGNNLVIYGNTVIYNTVFYTQDSQKRNNKSLDKLTAKKAQFL